MMTLHNMFILLGILVCSITAADGLKCVVCSPPCVPRPDPTECKESHCFSAKHETTGMGERGCKTPPDGKSKTCLGEGAAKICEEFCKTDGCNSAVTSTFNPFTLAGTIILFFVKNGIF